MLKLDLIDREVTEAMKGDKELYDLVKQTENILSEILNMKDIYINNMSDNDMKIINDAIGISRSTLVMAAHKREAIFAILENQKTIMDKIKDVDRKIDNLIPVNKQ